MTGLILHYSPLNSLGKGLFRVCTSYTATIDWGDGAAPSAGSVTGASGMYSVAGSYTYAVGGSYVITATVTNSAGQSTVVVSPATVSAPAITVTGDDFTAQQGAAANNYTIATITDPGPVMDPSTYGVVVDWGDGSTNTFGDSSVTLVNGTLTVLGTHQYATQGMFTVSTMVTNAGGATATATSTGTVTVGPLSASAATINAVEETPATNMTVATFSGTAGGYVATIDWGDESTPTNGTINGTSVQGSHTYATPGSYAVTVTLTDAASNSAEADSIAVVADANLGASSPSLTGVQGQSVAGVVATFTDANPDAQPGDFTAAITWGDGAEAAGTVVATANGFTVSGSNTYFEAGSYTVQVTITDPDGAAITSSATATISPSALTITAATLTPTQGVNLTNVPVATFTDAYADTVPTDYAVAINWGDGTGWTPGTVSGAGGTFSVSSSHTYAVAGSYSAVVDIANGGAPVVATGAVTVSPTPIYTVATFTDANLSDTVATFTASIDWGDGTALTAGLISGGNGTFIVSSAHAFPEPEADAGNVKVENKLGNIVVAAVFNWLAAHGALRLGVPADDDLPKPTPLDQPVSPQLKVQHLDFGGGLKIVSDDNKAYGTTWDLAQANKDRKTELLKEDPLAYVRNTSVEITKAVFQLEIDPRLFLGPLYAIGRVYQADGTPTNMTFKFLLSVSDDYKTASYAETDPVVASQPVSMVTNTTLDIVWTVKYGYFWSVPAGITSNLFYATYAKPSGPVGQAPRPLYESVLNAGSIYNGGQADTEQSVIANAWASFQALKVPSVKALRSGNADDVLKYYGNYSTAYGITTTAALLQKLDGGCTAWSEFFIDVLEAQGIYEKNWLVNFQPQPFAEATKIPVQMLVMNWKYPNPKTDPPAFTFPNKIGATEFKTLGGVNFWVNILPQSGGFVGNNSYVWDQQLGPGPQVTQDTAAPGNIPGQGNKAPASLFLNHTVVSLNGKLFDPSYGKTYAANTVDAGLKNFRGNLSGFLLGPAFLLLNRKALTYDPKGELTQIMLFFDPASTPAIDLVRNQNPAALAVY